MVNYGSLNLNPLYSIGQLNLVMIFSRYKRSVLNLKLNFTSLRSSLSPEILIYVGIIYPSFELFSTVNLILGTPVW